MILHHYYSKYCEREAGMDLDKTLVECSRNGGKILKLGILASHPRPSVNNCNKFILL